MSINSFAVVYRAGTSGKFVKALMSNIVTDRWTDICISRYGHAHRHPFRFLCRDLHDFDAVPQLQQQYDGVLVIARENRRDFLASRISFYLKYGLEDHHRGNSWITRDAVQSLTQQLGPERANRIYQNRYQQPYLDIMLYYMCRSMFEGDQAFQADQQFVDSVAAGCVRMPYNCITQGHTQVFVDCLEQLYQSKFSREQRDYAAGQFDTYYNAHVDLRLMTDPYAYYVSVRARALQALEGNI